MTQNTFKVNHQFNCIEKDLVYLLICNKCLKQYVGQTLGEFCQWWNNCKSNDRKIKCNMYNKTHSLRCERSFSYNHLHLIEGPDGVNHFTKSFAQILNFEYYCP